VTTLNTNANLLHQNTFQFGFLEEREAAEDNLVLVKGIASSPLRGSSRQKARARLLPRNTIQKNLVAGSRCQQTLSLRGAERRSNLLAQQRRGTASPAAPARSDRWACFSL
jgi:hypothetical protein